MQGCDDPWADLSHDAFIELMTATEQTLRQELREDVALLGGGDEAGARQYEDYLQAEEERLKVLINECNENCNTMVSITTTPH